MQFRNYFVTFIIAWGSLLSSNKAEALLASVKSTGMAGTAIAYPLDSLAIAYNPAGITLVGDRLDLGFYWVHAQGSSHVSNNHSSHANHSFNGISPKNFYSGDAGIVKQFCGECLTGAVGIAVYDRNFQKTRFNRIQTLFGTSKQGLEYTHITVAPTFAFQLWDSHAFGLSLDWQLERVKVTGLENFASPFFSLHDKHVTNRGYNYSQGVTVTVGWRSQLYDWLAFGATYQPKTHMSRLKKYKGFLVRGKLDVPEKVGLGFAIYPMPCLVFCFDTEWIRWSQVRAFANPLLHHGVLGVLGSRNGPGFGFRNQWYYRVGVEYMLSCCWTLRAGFRYAATPIRSREAAVNSLTLDLVQNVATIGATWNLDESNEISAFFAYGFPHKIKGDHVIPLIPFGGGDVSLKERKYALGISWGWLY